MHGNRVMQIALFGAFSAIIVSYFVEPMWKKLT